MRLHRLISLVILAGSPAVAAVCPANVDTTSAQLGQITRKTPLYADATSDGNLCKTTGRCGSSGYLIAGDLVVVHARQGDWACIEFTSVQGKPTCRRAVPQSSLKLVQQPGPPEGTWRYGDNHLFLRRNGKELLVRGWAQWPWEMGALPIELKRLKESGPDVGYIDSKALWAGDQAAVTFKQGDSSDACTVNLRTLGPYLLVTDNTQCGGLNVSFSGTYRRLSSSVSDKDWQRAKAP